MLLQLTVDTTTLLSSPGDWKSTPSFWLSIFGTAQLIVTGYLIFRLRKKSKLVKELTARVSELTVSSSDSLNSSSLSESLKEARHTSIDFSDLMNNINKSEALYSELIKKYHPDRFLDETKNRIATELSKEIVQNKHSYSRLKALEQKAYSLLN